MDASPNAPGGTDQTGLGTPLASHRPLPASPEAATALPAEKSNWRPRALGASSWTPPIGTRRGARFPSKPLASGRAFWSMRRPIGRKWNKGVGDANRCVLPGLGAGWLRTPVNPRVSAQSRPADGSSLHCSASSLLTRDSIQCANEAVPASTVQFPSAR